MQGLVTLDFGNSHPHAGIFQKEVQDWKLIKVVPFSELSIFLNQLGMTPNNSQMVLCEVKEREEELFPYLRQGYLLTRIKDYWRGGRFAGMPVDYAKTLGEDRLLGAFYRFKTSKCATLVIDAGTYVTMDVVTEKGLEGGFILPGLRAYYSSFKQGENLRTVDFQGPPSKALPHLTEDAMKNGYTAFALLALDLIKEKNIKQVILTGGEAHQWKSLLNEAEALVSIEEHFLHWAIQHWMVTQIEPI
jgi:pantothenate kinase type III